MCFFNFFYLNSNVINFCLKYAVEFTETKITYEQEEEAVA